MNNNTTVFRVPGAAGGASSGRTTPSSEDSGAPAVADKTDKSRDPAACPVAAGERMTMTTPPMEGRAIGRENVEPTLCTRSPRSWSFGSQCSSVAEEMPNKSRDWSQGSESDVTDSMTVSPTRTPNGPPRRNSGGNTFSPLVKQGSRPRSSTVDGPPLPDKLSFSPMLRARVEGYSTASSSASACEQADLPNMQMTNGGLAGYLKMRAGMSPRLVERRMSSAPYTSPLIGDADIKMDPVMAMMAGDATRRRSDPTLSSTRIHAPAPQNTVSPPRGGTNRLKTSLASMKSLKSSIA